MLCLAALGSVLSDLGLPVHVGDAEAAAHQAYASMHAKAAQLKQQKKEREQLEAAKKNRTPPPAPSFSTRAKLVDLSLQADQRAFMCAHLPSKCYVIILQRYLGYYDRCLCLHR